MKYLISPKGVKNRGGFTLLEILVVLGIIALILTVSAVSYTTAQRKSRDSKRKTDLRSIQSAMEQYYSICGYQYPLVSGNRVPTIGCTDPNTIIMQTVPADPRTTTPYPANGNATSYSICVNAFEAESGSYCVYNQQ